MGKNNKKLKNKQGLLLKSKVDGKNKITKKFNNKPRKTHTWRSEREKKSKQTGAASPDQVSYSGSSLSLTCSKQPAVTSSLRSRMQERLNIARFRLLNESMDSQSSSSSTSLLLHSKSNFEAYHKGLQSASSSWKTNPLHHIVNWLKSTIPPTKIVADFGCGTALLAKSIPHQTHSFDLHALDPAVVACDMRNVPLDNESVDVVVFCLSLMGSDVGDYIREAWRVLRVGGFLKIAEVMGRLGNGNRFVRQVEGNGFKIVGGGKGRKKKQKGGGGSSIIQVLGGDAKMFGVCAFRKVDGGGDLKMSSSNVVLDSVVYKKR